MSKPNWAHQTIWTGDNLDIMRGMNSNTVDLVYLDPPFNSNADYSAPIGSEAAGAEFKDTWGLSDINMAWHGLIKHEHPGLYSMLLAVRDIHNDSMMSYLIYMAPRIMEMKRLLKDTGSIYLHCDTHASHYLKLMMDDIFGKTKFRNEITWVRSNPHNDVKNKYPRVSDSILYYAGDNAQWRPVYVMPSKETQHKRYPYQDSKGRFATSPLHARGLAGGGYDYTWKGITDTWRYPKPRLDELEKDGLIHWPKDGKGIPRRKRYLSDYKGNAVTDVITDVKSKPSEKTHFPTQKPVALVERFIESSTQSGDMVLDPFCGCATACIAAQKLDRQWVGIDISAKAADLVELRMEKELGLFWQGVHRTDAPERDDLGDVPAYNCAENKKWLYGEQGGYCNACEHHFEMRHFDVDHIIPKSKGGTDHISNLQLLCGNCNSIKGNRPQEWLLSRLLEKDYIKQRLQSDIP